jgi:hypothetical protein
MNQGSLSDIDFVEALVYLNTMYGGHLSSIPLAFSLILLAGSVWWLWILT